MFSQFVAVGIGAMIGAWLRWGLSHALNATLPPLPLGTLAANLAGGLAMGVVMELVARNGLLSPEVRLFLATGLLGGLTTFSAFSAEAAALLLRGEWAWSAALVLAHVVGSIVLTLAGVWIVRTAFAAVA